MFLHAHIQAFKHTRTPMLTNVGVDETQAGVDEETQGEASTDYTARAPKTQRAPPHTLTHAHTHTHTLVQSHKRTPHTRTMHPPTHLVGQRLELLVHHVRHRVHVSGAGPHQAAASLAQLTQQGMHVGLALPAEAGWGGGGRKEGRPAQTVCSAVA